ncbi:MAG: hypothetical protein RL885_10820 [Planctomycetota bacterium]
MARLAGFQGDLGDRAYPQTNGWTFWKVRDLVSGELIELDALRRRIN